MTEEQKRKLYAMDETMRYKWAESICQECPTEWVYKRYHTKQVPVYFCRLCKYAVRFKWHGGIACGYGKD